MNTKKARTLTEAQMELLAYLRGGRECPVGKYRTLESLERRGLVGRMTGGEWAASQDGWAIIDGMEDDR